MQSLLIFIAEFQTAKKRLLKNFELSDDSRFSRERNDDAHGRIERLSVLSPGRAIRCMKEEKLLSHGVILDTLRRNQNRIG